MLSSAILTSRKLELWTGTSSIRVGIGAAQDHRFATPSISLLERIDEIQYCRHPQHDAANDVAYGDVISKNSGLPC